MRTEFAEAPKDLTFACCNKDVMSNIELQWRLWYEDRPATAYHQTTFGGNALDLDTKCFVFRSANKMKMVSALSKNGKVKLTKSGGSTLVAKGYYVNIDKNFVANSANLALTPLLTAKSIVKKIANIKDQRVTVLSPGALVQTFEDKLLQSRGFFVTVAAVKDGDPAPDPNGGKILYMTAGDNTVLDLASLVFHGKEPLEG